MGPNRSLASKGKRAHPGILKISLPYSRYHRNLMPVAWRICTAVFHAGLQPEGCTKQLIEDGVGRSFA